MLNIVKSFPTFGGKSDIKVILHKPNISQSTVDSMRYVLGRAVMKPETEHTLYKTKDIMKAIKDKELYPSDDEVKMFEQMAKFYDYIEI